MPLCPTCTSLNLGPIAPRDDNSPPSWEEEDAEVRLGPYDTLLTRAKTCSNCQFFIDILHTSSRYSLEDGGVRVEKLEGKVIFLDSKRLDVRDAGEGEESRTWGVDDLLFDVVVDEGFVGDKNPELDIRRIIPEDPMHEKCISEIKSWLGECSTTHHSSCCKIEETTLPVIIIEIPIDSSLTPRLVSTEGKKGKYFAISHCVHEEEDPIFSSEDIEKFRHGIDIDTLPKLFVEAIAVTRKLGYEYLWIKSLCSTTSTLSNSMVYKDATLLLSADNSPDTKISFLRPRKNFYSPALGAHKNQYYRLALLRWREDIDNSPLTAQLIPALERILAPRVLHFTKRQLIWECAGGWKYEGIGVENKKYGSGQARMHYRKGFVQPFLSSGDPPENPEDDVRGNATLATKLEAWYSCSDEFSRRLQGNLVAKIELAATLARELDDGTLGEYLGGVWSGDIPFGFAWARQYALLTLPETYKAPSWSWGSVNGVINHSFLTRQAGSDDDLAWNEKFLPNLLSHSMIRVNPEDPYSVLEEGSSMTLLGSVAPFRAAAEVISREEGRDVSMNPIFDQSPMFDCSCCIPRSAEVQKNAAEQFTKSIDHHVLFVLGRSTTSDKPIKDVLCLLLRAVDGRDSVFRRVGLALMGIYDHGDDGGRDAVGKLMTVFDKVEWERREIVLV